MPAENGTGDAALTAALDGLAVIDGEARRDPVTRAAAFVALGQAQLDRVRAADAARSFTEAVRALGDLDVDDGEGTARLRVRALRGLGNSARLDGRFADAMPPSRKPCP